MGTLTIIFAFAILIGIIGIFIRISMRVRKGGGSMLVVCSGATDAFYSKDKKKAIEMIVEKNAGKKMEEESSSEPEQ
ncbi:hypothetical protein BMS3Bbin03_00024 [bacterium BMS3Bbin03]|nr:hypothetical protein BMS3Bbin03_00024 [bacterium BMS3Bbin03]